LNEPHVDIRQALENDLPAVLRLYAQPGVNDGRVLPLDAAIQIFRRFATYPNYRLYVAAKGADIVGTFELLVMHNLAHLGAPSAIVEDVCVDEQLRGQGIGAAMMKFAMKVAASAGCYKLTLSSNLKRQRAHAFYESLGFAQHGISFHVDLR
jgi:GNAT superfamily N-acetyltransferase